MNRTLPASMGYGCPKRGIEEGPFVANGQLNQIAAVLVNDVLRPADKDVQFFPDSIVAIVIQPAEAQHQRGHRAQIPQDLRSATELVMDGRQQPWSPCRQRAKPETRNSNSSTPLTVTIILSKAMS